MTNSNYTKLVEMYLDGEMSQAEMRTFEQLRTQDPLLSDEFNAQNEIIEGIKDFRKAELKMRLNNIDITPGLLQTSTYSTALKVASVAIFTGVVFVGSYLWFNEPQKAENINLKIQSRSVELNHSTFNQAIADKLPTRALPQTGTSNKIDIPNSTVEIVEAITDEPKETEKIPIPAIVSPNLADATLDESPSPEVAADIALTITNSNKSLEVEVEHTNGKNFQYKFFNNKLYLYGNFSGVPYEILEINSPSGKKLFLFHDNKFYRIDNNVSNILPLEEISSPNVLEELMIIRESKTH